MISTTPGSLFGLDPQSQPQPAQAPAEAFRWGQGGAQLTPDDIAMRRKMAMQNIAAGSDYSPVSSWTQGAARVAQALIGGMENHDLNKASAANASHSSEVAKALIAGQGGAGTAAAAFADPYANDGVRDLAKMQLQAANRPPPQPSEFERMVAAGNYTPDERTRLMRQRTQNLADPMQAVTVYGEDGSSGLQFVRPSAMQGGGDQTSGAQGAAPPAAPPTNFADFGSSQAMLQSMGSKGFLGWQQQHGVPVRVNSPEEMAGLPAGTIVVSPDGRQGVKR